MCMTFGWASIGRIKPWPGWSPTLLSLLRRVVVPDQQAVLVREVGDQFPAGIREVVGAELERLVIAPVFAVLGEVVVEDEAGDQ